MKKLIIFTFLIFIYILAKCQTTFNKLYSPYPNNPNFTFVLTSIAKNGNNYVASGCGNDTINSNYQSVIFIKIDSLGNVIRKYSFTKAGWNYYPGAQTIINLKRGGFLFLGQKDTSNLNPEQLLIRFDENLDTLWTKTIHNYNEEWEAYRKVIETSDNGLVFVGGVEINAGSLRVLIVKADSSGNEIWRKNYYLPDDISTSGVIETPDKGFLIKGFRDSYITSNGGPFLIKTDSSGNVQWSKNLGGNQYDGSAAIALTNDSNFLVAFGYATYSYPQNDGWKAILNVIKYNLEGTQLWSKFYDTIYSGLLVTKIQILPDNNFIVMGSYEIINNKYFFSPFLFKFNSNGDSLWSKYYYLSDSSGDFNCLYDNVLNADGSITACGMVFSIEAIITPYQQIWLLKTDSTGYAPGPQNVSIIDLPYFHLGFFELKVFPNPASTQGTVSFPMLKENSELELYNNLGQIIYSTNLYKNSTQCILYTQDYKKGSYKVILREKGEIRGQASFIIAN